MRHGIKTEHQSGRWHLGCRRIFLRQHVTLINEALRGRRFHAGHHGVMNACIRPLVRWSMKYLNVILQKFDGLGHVRLNPISSDGLSRMAQGECRSINAGIIVKKPKIRMAIMAGGMFERRRAVDVFIVKNDFQRAARQPYRVVSAQWLPSCVVPLLFR